MSKFNMYASSSPYADNYTVPAGAHAALAQAQQHDLISPTGYSNTSGANRGDNYAAIVANIGFDKSAGASLA